MAQGWYATQTIGIPLFIYIGRTAGEMRPLGMVTLSGKKVVPDDVPDDAVFAMVAGGGCAFQAPKKA